MQIIIIHDLNGALQNKEELQEMNAVLECFVQEYFKK